MKAAKFRHDGGGSKLKAVNQGARLHSDCFGNPQKRMETDPLLAAFHLANINRMQLGFFSQFFLAQARLSAALADGVPENFKLL